MSKNYHLKSIHKLFFKSFMLIPGKILACLLILVVKYQRQDLYSEFEVHRPIIF